MTGRRQLHIVYPGMPPSSNKMYFRGTILSSKARRYAEEFAKFAAQKHLHEIMELDKDAGYALHLRFFLDTLEVESWFDPKKRNHPDEKKRVKSRYKRIDLDNRIKLLTDCVRDAIGIDDSQIFAASQEKHQDPTNPRIEIFVQVVDIEQFGLTRMVPMA